MKHLTRPVCDERERVGKAEGFLSSGAPEAVSEASVEHMEENSNCVSGGYVGGTGYQSCEGK